MGWIRNRSTRRQTSPIPGLDEGERPVLVHALDGFLGAGSGPRVAAEYIGGDDGMVVESLDVDEYYDYRARRPPLIFDEDHYREYEPPTLDVRLHRDQVGTPYLMLAGPEPDYRWEAFAIDVADVIEQYDVGLTVGMGAVPMGVPHTRPLVVTQHANRKALVDQRNLWNGQVVVPASAQALLEYRLGEWGFDAMGYVVHVPHYLAQVDYPAASIALLESVSRRTGLRFELDELRARQVEAIADIEDQIREQDGGAVLANLEQQYDAFSRGANQSLLASDEALPSGDELGRQFEQFLAQVDKRDDD
ncbi:PAC2 family protein [Solicola gregarius]|uniref:PAC2 family protein n=1 Tax=Solicola gregarius TaxID=2908642 RepID=A0AA46TI02_9ACTN|nr:PAC2 family protein [Solicola gregarius]UYM04868.1 PAC2 family protein [Solicola gregarius]